MNFFILVCYYRGQNQESKQAMFFVPMRLGTYLGKKQYKKYNHISNRKFIERKTLLFYLYS